jgi:hypothetical protein
VPRHVDRVEQVLDQLDRGAGVVLTHTRDDGLARRYVGLRVVRAVVAYPSGSVRPFTLLSRNPILSNHLICFHSGHSLPVGEPCSTAAHWSALRAMTTAAFQGASSETLLRFSEVAPHRLGNVL